VQTLVCSWWAFGTLHIYPSVLQGVWTGGEPHSARGAFSGRIGVWLCTILHTNFREFAFYDVRE
jgi:hypothetical protein